MKSICNPGRWILLAVMFFGIRVEAQTVLLNVTEAPDPVVVSNSITFNIGVTNTTGIAVQNILVTNIPFPACQFVSASGSFVQTTANIVFSTGPMIAGQGTNFTLVIKPLVVGTQTNYFSASTTNFPGNITTNNVLTTVLSAPSSLTVILSGFSPLIYLNDWLTYKVTLTNGGGGALQNIQFTNILPAGVKLIGVSPTNTTPFTNNLLTYTVSRPTNSAIFYITVQPTNTGSFTFIAHANKTSGATNTITVTNFLSGSTGLVAFITSTQFFSHFTARLQQTVVVSNAGPEAVPAARLIVTGLTNRLINAVGTNDGNPYVVLGAPINTNDSVSLTLQYSPNRTAFPFDNSQLMPVSVTTPNLALPLTGLSSTNHNIVLLTNLSDGTYMVEFKAVTNRSYTIGYSDNMTDWFAAQPPLTAGANYAVFIDYGPPETLSNSPSRMYRVYLNP